MAKEKKEFDFVNLPPECNDPSIKQEDFKLVQVDEKIHDQKFETKPTTFFKDCLRRFVKNKSSVVATFILGILVLMSIIVPVAFSGSDIHKVDKEHNSNLYIEYLEPKLFKAGTGFWDGTKKMSDIPVDTKGSDNRDDWVPAGFKMNAVSNLHIGELQYTKTPNEYAKEGYIQFGYFSNIPDDIEYISYSSDPSYMTSLSNGKFKFDHSLKITNFVTLDEEKLANSDEKTKEYPEGYTEAESALYFVFSEGSNIHSVKVIDYQKAHAVGEGEEAVDIKPLFDAFKSEYNSQPGLDPENYITNDILSPGFEIRVKNAKNHENSCTLIKSVGVESSSPTEAIKNDFDKYSFESGNQVFIRSEIYNRIKGNTEEEIEQKYENSGIWKSTSSSTYSKETSYLVKAVLCSFTYDTYEAALGAIDDKLYNVDLLKMKNLDIIRYSIKTDGDNVSGFYVTKCECEILNEEDCYLVKPFEAKDVVLDQTTGLVKYVNCQVYRYKKEFGLSKMPTFVLGTDKQGLDMFVYVFKGLRTSLLIGVAASAICFVFGLIWGSISGYFGGTVDLLMERFTDILAGIPWIVVMTLTIINLGDKPFFSKNEMGELLLFMIALCLTGWIGTSHTTRTQFYRFRGREYVLASRTLGASHGRLIAKHILPNAMGTIITSAVLMVPSIIFSEATISYLGLGLKGMKSLGVILADNQSELTNHPYLLIFPSVIIALLMISFNLFGNGLRDAVNPSLKGEGE